MFVFSADGEILAGGVPDSFASATVLVADVTDALKSISLEGLVQGTIDRGSVARLEAFVLSAETLRMLEDDDLDPAGLIRAVSDLGVEWGVAPASAVLQPQDRHL